MSSPYDDLVPEPAPETQPEPTKPLEVIDVKSIFKSKTIWTNLVAGAVAVVTHLADSDLVADNPELAMYFGTGLAVLNLLLRLVTKEPVSVTGK